MSECQDIVERYIAAVESQVRCTEVDGRSLIIDTPYTYFDGDAIQLYAELHSEGLIRLADAGKALIRLEQSGVNLGAPKVRSALGSIVRSYRLDLLDEEVRLDSTAERSGDGFLRMIGALREIDALRFLRRESAAPRFSAQVVTYLRSVLATVDTKPEVVGLSGTKYSLTAKLVIAEPKSPRQILTQAVSGGKSETGLRSVNYAYRAFSDINGQVPSSGKLVVLSSDAASWRPEDLRILGTVAYVGGWWDRERITSFLKGQVPSEHHLFPTQQGMSEA